MSDSALQPRPTIAARLGIWSRPGPRARWPYVVLALAPIVIVAAWRLPLINQLNFADAWFYTGYAFVPKHEFEIFGWNYFAVRFPAIFLIGLFERVFGAAGGYVVLRYLLAIACGWTMFGGLRRFVGVPAALAGALLLLLDPFFSRMLLWDYSGFIETAAGVIGFVLWYWAEDRSPLWTLPAGIALSVAAYANALIGTALFVFVVVEGLAAIRGGMNGVMRYVVRLLVVVASAVVVFVVGYVGYLGILHSLSPWQLLRPTVQFLTNNAQEASPYQFPISSWILHEPRIWAPVVVSLALIGVLRRRLLDTGVRARIAQLCVAYTAFLWLYRFAVPSSVVETWYAYSVTVIVVAPATTILLAELDGDGRSTTRRIVFATAAFAVISLVIRDIPGPIDTAYTAIGRHPWIDALVLALGILSAGACASRAARPMAICALMTIAAIMCYAPSVLDARGTTGLFVRNGAAEWDSYQADKQFLDLVRRYDSPTSRVFLWWPGTLGETSITWSDLPQSGDTLNAVGVNSPLDHVPPVGIARLKAYPVRYVLVLAPRENQVSHGLAALNDAQVRGHVLVHGRFSPSALRYALFEVTKP